jgi:HPt (histidine-containing phosphotransfer) domain-containing protein
MAEGSGEEGQALAFDFARLADISGGDAEFEREILSDYLAQNLLLLDELDRALAAGDAVSLTRAAHTLKGSSRTVGAEALASVAGEVERLAGSGNLAAAAGPLGRVRGVWASTQAALDARFGREPFRKAG